MKWTIDPTHTSIEFAVRHLGISTVRGRFEKAFGVIETDDTSALQLIDATIASDSINTAVPERDAHLRSPDFLSVGTYPEIRFRSTTIVPLHDGRYLVRGNLTIRGQARPVTFEMESTHPVPDPFSGRQKAGATATGTLNRKDWGLTWNQILEFGALLVGEEVRFTIDVEALAHVPERVT